MDQKTALILEQMLKKISNLENLVDHWKFYDIARVAENKTRTTNNILVYLPTHTPEMTGEGFVEKKKESVTFKDDDGNDETVEIEHTSAVEAVWIPMADRSENAPDVRKGERVFLYRYADSDTLYWMDTGLDRNLRRLETKTILFSAEPDGKSDVPRSAENSYAMHVSTHDKIVRFTTTNLNGEPFTYTIELDTDFGRFTILDDVGNVIQLDSKNTRILLENKDKTRIVLDKKNIDVYAPNNIDVLADNDMTVECQNLTVTAHKDITVQCENESTTANSNIDVKCKNYSLTADTSYKVKSAKATFDVPTTTFTGLVNVSKTVTAAGMTSTGPMQVSAPSTFSAPMTAMGITSSAPIKGPDGSI